MEISRKVCKSFTIINFFLYVTLNSTKMSVGQAWNFGNWGSWWTISLDGRERSSSWSVWSTVLAFVWRDWGRHRILHWGQSACRPRFERGTSLHLATPLTVQVFFATPLHNEGHAVAHFVETLLYKPKGRGFFSRWCHWNFSLKQSFRIHYVRLIR